MLPVDHSVCGCGRYGPESACCSKICTISGAIDEPSKNAAVASGNAEGSACRNVVLSTECSSSSQHGPNGRESGICTGRGDRGVTRSRLNVAHHRPKPAGKARWRRSVCMRGLCLTAIGELLICRRSTQCQAWLKALALQARFEIGLCRARKPTAQATPRQTTEILPMRRERKEDQGTLDFASVCRCPSKPTK